MFIDQLCEAVMLGALNTVENDPSTDIVAVLRQ